MFFFFSSRRRHTRCALVTGVQTCALPISLGSLPLTVLSRGRRSLVSVVAVRQVGVAAVPGTEGRLRLLGKGNCDRQPGHAGARSEERRVGKECVSTCRSRWSP